MEWAEAVEFTPSYLDFPNEGKNCVVVGFGCYVINGRSFFCLEWSSPGPSSNLGSNVSLRFGGWLVVEVMGDSSSDKSIMVIGGVEFFRAGDCFVSSISGSLQGGGGLVSREGGVARSKLSVRTTCGISSVLVPTADGGVEGAGGLASVSGVPGDGPGQG